MLYIAKAPRPLKHAEASAVCATMLASPSPGSSALIPICNVRHSVAHPSCMIGAEPSSTALLRLLITRHASERPTPSSLPTLPFFNSLPISTLNFLDRTNFTTKTREEKISFMKGLTSVLDRFSEGLRTRKILPSLLEEVRFVRD